MKNNSFKRDIIDFFVHQSSNHNSFSFTLKEIVDSNGSYRQKTYRHLQQLVEYGVLEKLDTNYRLSDEFIDIIETVAEHIVEKTVPTHEFLFYALTSLEKLSN